MPQRRSNPGAAGRLLRRADAPARPGSTAGAECPHAMISWTDVRQVGGSVLCAAQEDSRVAGLLREGRQGGAARQRAQEQAPHLPLRAQAAQGDGREGGAHVLPGLPVCHRARARRPRVFGRGRGTVGRDGRRAHRKGGAHAHRGASKHRADAAGARGLFGRAAGRGRGQDVRSVDLRAERAVSPFARAHRDDYRGRSRWSSTKSASCRGGEKSTRASPSSCARTSTCSR